MLIVCACVALGACSTTDMNGGDSGGSTADSGNSTSSTATSPGAGAATSGVPRIPETSASAYGASQGMTGQDMAGQDMARQDTARQNGASGQDKRTSQDYSRQNMPPDTTGGAADARGASGSMAGTSGTSGTGSAGNPLPQGLSTHGVAQAVELIPRSQALGVGGSVAGAAVGGTLAGTAGVGGNSSTSPNDMVYRIIVRFDDGTTRSMMQDTAPGIQNGDRVRVNSNGMLMRE